ncbi:uncharacterized protein RCO7_14387 [Rhynchosporium graminicola]|uniref:Uncharacterized protein n=1 Tax=Rhynchosporium graminicola TaxID=2792576 RepID=A0A1E1KCI3_9HELO|nr:uncharacterized protein RCO7_14387 [Rhynchosporium commune]
MDFMMVEEGLKKDMLEEIEVEVFWPVQMESNGQFDIIGSGGEK